MKVSDTDVNSVVKNSSLKELFTFTGNGDIWSNIIKSLNMQEKNQIVNNAKNRLRRSQSFANMSRMFIEVTCSNVSNVTNLSKNLGT